MTYLVEKWKKINELNVLYLDEVIGSHQYTNIIHNSF